jgi:hypothetical protein
MADAAAESVKTLSEVVKLFADFADSLKETFLPDEALSAFHKLLDSAKPVLGPTRTEWMWKDVQEMKRVEDIQNYLRNTARCMEKEDIMDRSWQAIAQTNPDLKVEGMSSAKPSRRSKMKKKMGTRKRVREIVKRLKKSKRLAEGVSESSVSVTWNSMDTNDRKNILDMLGVEGSEKLSYNSFIALPDQVRIDVKQALEEPAGRLTEGAEGLEAALQEIEETLKDNISEMGEEARKDVIDTIREEIDEVDEDWLEDIFGKYLASNIARAAAKVTIRILGQHGVQKESMLAPMVPFGMMSKGGASYHGGGVEEARAGKRVIITSGDFAGMEAVVVKRMGTKLLVESAGNFTTKFHGIKTQIPRGHVFQISEQMSDIKVEPKIDEMGYKKWFTLAQEALKEAMDKDASDEDIQKLIEELVQGYFKNKVGMMDPEVLRDRLQGYIGNMQVLMKQPELEPITSGFPGQVPITGVVEDISKDEAEAIQISPAPAVIGKDCPTCSGTGCIPDFPKGTSKKCPMCKGKKKDPMAEGNRPASMQEITNLLKGMIPGKDGVDQSAGDAQGIAEKKVNPWAVCAAQGLKPGTDKYERCCIPGTKITMADGTSKLIEEIKVDDMILTHLGNAKPVTKIVKRGVDEELVQIKVSGVLEPLTTTVEHPVFAIKQPNRIGWPPPDVLYELENKPEFVPAKTLRVGDCIHSPSLKTGNSDISIDEDMAYLLGMYCAEGFVQGDRNRPDTWMCGHHGASIRHKDNDSGFGVVLCLSEVDEKRGILERVLNICGRKFRAGKTHVSKIISRPDLRLTYINSRAFASLCEDHCGKGAKSKRLSKDLMNSSVAIQLSFLAGYLHGDGWFGDPYHKSTVKASSVSRNLVEQLFWMTERCGIVSTVRKFVSPGGPGNRAKKSEQWVIEINGSNSWKLNRVLGTEYPIYNKRGHRFAMAACTFGRILSVGKVRHEGLVYNLHVADDESYVANLCSVHNCVMDIKRKQGMKEDETEESFKKEDESEPREIQCKCGEKLPLDGDTECPKCGQWYNAFGQKLKDPSKWRDEPDADEAKDGKASEEPTHCEHCGTQLSPDANCPKCRISHAGAPCPDCGRYGWHKDDCPQMKEAQKP